MVDALFSLAMQRANEAYEAGEVPVGAVLALGKTPLADSGNLAKQLNNPLMHAEMVVIERAVALVGAEKLRECDLYVTLEPCPMCAHAVSLMKIRRVYFGADCPFGWGVKTWGYPGYKPEFYGGFRDQESCQLLKTFFAELRKSGGDRATD